MSWDLNRLQTRWQSLFGDVGTAAARKAVLDQLIAAYTGVDRHYHDIRHIADCLQQLDSVRSQARDAKAIEAAIWFHDVVYDGRRKDNEQLSAEASQTALNRLNAAEPFRAEVEHLIMLTRHDHTPESMDGKILVDIDLSSLALPPAAFDENSAKIRKEYAHMDEAEFNRGRLKLLGEFLGRPRIYYTDEFFNRYESQARQNLQRTLSRLEEDTGAHNGR
jgi:predicted metal-dependent HD superfamily phosphohydrolase